MSVKLFHRRRYIYLWIYYAVYEELKMSDLERASQVYDACLSIIPHAKFSFSKIWINAAKLFVRRKDLQSARKMFGRAIGMCGKEKIFVEYIALELALGEVDRCRTLYGNYLKAMPHNCRAWAKFAELEKSLGESEVSTVTTVVLLLGFEMVLTIGVHLFAALTHSDVELSTSWR
jgi:crooked neck